MRHLLFAAFLLLSQWTFSQTITGVVREKGSGLPLPFANVFVNNTTLGASTDMDGKFTIEGRIPEEFELVASFVGYATVSQQIKRKGKSNLIQNFELAQLEDNLTEIQLKAKRDKSWERNLKLFKDVFLAVPDDPYGRDIEILNPWVLDFEKVRPGKGFGYLRATAQQPLQLVNKALGYQIDYNLQDFRLLRNASRYFGQAFYREMAPQDSLPQEIWDENRGKNYQSSLRHLALSILLRDSGAEGFELYLANPNVPKEDRTNDFYYELKKSIIPVNASLIYVKPLGNGVYRIHLPERVEIHHLKKPWPADYYENVYHAISWIVAPSGYFDVDRYGTLMHPSQLAVSGFLGRQRMARSLPLDFEPNEQFSGLVDEFQGLKNRPQALNALREKAWITTNKSFYYSGETLWLGGQMMYQSPAKQDTLSRVVYVDILSERLKVIHHESFPINEGKISGGLVLSDTLSSGNYLLRAYTRWSLNFPEKDMFQIPFPILDRNEFLVGKVEEEGEDVLGDFELETAYALTDSANYQVMDLDLRVLDSYGNPVDGSLFISALEDRYEVELDEKLRLNNSLDWLDVKLPDSFDSELVYPIEYGISVEGKYFPSKKRGELATGITIVKGDLEDYGVVSSDSSGYFWATGMQFQDTAKVAIAALNDKRSSLGTIDLLYFLPPVFRGSFPKQTYQVLQLPQQEESLMDISGDFIELAEFVKEGEKEQETMAERNYGYGAPTREVGSSDLETKTLAEIYGLLGFNPSTMKFRNSSYGEKTGAPLLIIDGFNMPYLEANEFKDILNSFEPSQLLSIKVYYGGVGNAVFGLAGYSGVLMIETKKGERFGPDEKRKFDSTQFQMFEVKGFSSFPEFPNDPPADTYLPRKATIYWNPLAKTEEGKIKVRLKIPQGTQQLSLKVQGITPEGEAFYQVVKIPVNK